MVELSVNAHLMFTLHKLITSAKVFSRFIHYLTFMLNFSICHKDCTKIFQEIKINEYYPHFFYSKKHYFLKISAFSLWDFCSDAQILKLFDLSHYLFLNNYFIPHF